MEFGFNKVVHLAGLVPDCDIGVAGAGAAGAAEAGLAPRPPDGDLCAAGAAIGAPGGAEAGLAPQPPDGDIGAAGADAGAPGGAEAEAGLAPRPPDSDDVGAAGAAFEPAARAKRREKWPRASASTPWQLAPIFNLGVQTGWGATCACHSNDAERAAGNTIKCNKHLGTPAGRSHAETRLLVMQWLVRGGRDIPQDHPTGRTEHVIKMNPWSFERMDEAELERLAMELWP